MPVYDHLGNEFKTKIEMCRYWNIDRGTFSTRIRAGWNLEKALTVKVSNGKECYDHIGNRFNSITAMCKQYSILPDIYIKRMNSGWSIEDALTKGNTSTIKCKDHLGNEYNSIKEMCNAYNISHNAYSNRVRKNWGLEKTLTTPIKEVIHDDIMVFGEIIRGGVPKAAKVYKIKNHILKNRLANIYNLTPIEVEVCVVVPSGEIWSLHPIFINLDGKAYYKLSWSTDPVNTRQIIAHYRPDLLEAYDKSNPTGEYRPYIQGGTEK